MDFLNGLNLTYLSFFVFTIRNDISGALTTILENAPYGPSVDEAKVRTGPLELIPPLRCIKHNPLIKNKLITLQTLLTILNTTKSTEILGVIKGLSLDTQDTLMKYLYKGMGIPGWGDISGSVLLGWHEKVSIFICRCRVAGEA